MFALTSMCLIAHYRQSHSMPVVNNFRLWEGDTYTFVIVGMWHMKGSRHVIDLTHKISIDSVTSADTKLSTIYTCNIG